MRGRPAADSRGGVEGIEGEAFAATWGGHGATDRRSGRGGHGRGTTERERERVARGSGGEGRGADKISGLHGGLLWWVKLAAPAVSKGATVPAPAGVVNTLVPIPVLSAVLAIARTRPG